MRKERGFSQLYASVDQVISPNGVGPPLPFFPFPRQGTLSLQHLSSVIFFFRADGRQELTYSSII